MAWGHRATGLLKVLLAYVDRDRRLLLLLLLLLGRRRIHGLRLLGSLVELGLVCGGKGMAGTPHPLPDRGGRRANLLTHETGRDMVLELEMSLTLRLSRIYTYILCCPSPAQPV